jgi:ATP-dependent DNA helicase PIF1
MMVIQLVEEDSLRHRLITGTHVGEKVYIPRIIMSPVESAWPFLLNQRQYLIFVCFKKYMKHVIRLKKSLSL